jgi:hypothetical protein
VRSSCALTRAFAGARGGIRTRTPFRTADFESAASAVPPPGHGALSQRTLQLMRFPRPRTLLRLSVVAALITAAREWAFSRNDRR